jgi:hypothetical protein
MVKYVFNACPSIYLIDEGRHKKHFLLEGKEKTQLKEMGREIKSQKNLDF